MCVFLAIEGEFSQKYGMVLLVTLIQDSFLLFYFYFENIQVDILNSYVAIVFLLIFI